jgi:hypothetical protein
VFNHLSVIFPDDKKIESCINNQIFLEFVIFTYLFHCDAFIWVQCLVLGNYLRAVTWDSTGIPPSIGASHGTVVGVDTVQPRPFCVGAVDEVLADGGMNNAVVPDHAITGAPVQSLR